MEASFRVWPSLPRRTDDLTPGPGSRRQLSLSSVAMQPCLRSRACSLPGCQQASASARTRQLQPDAMSAPVVAPVMDARSAIFVLAQRQLGLSSNHLIITHCTTFLRVASVRSALSHSSHSICPIPPILPLSLIPTCAIWRHAPDSHRHSAGHSGAVRARPHVPPALDLSPPVLLRRFPRSLVRLRKL